MAAAGRAGLMEADLVSVNDSCHAGEEHSGDSRQTSERVGCKASLQLEVEEDYSPSSSPGCILLDLQSDKKSI
ncbi:hypothetical protein QYF61_005870 [Mycteria americana]|uniref:Uncharacterized protein n=1 Tax=Mycteria americana TaxID=33587 RepID=A0AAN7N7V6_MYCAM|nr:hypothetical protein QYF61_005870 [Mycteria americana]